ncbi:methyltransferase [Actinosynnema sp. ALI-1.44]|uniref:methyltransferase n=1 Tax=Actinosynnema sp. ALI-1.44 TaxID=1933779 RepID=UPI00097BF778|nr:methyltransferase [Actinosynnema sp. ALI-1.44]ONI78137.1 methyltransferase [Actinosynnema sp. ALI-1.44]
MTSTGPDVRTPAGILRLGNAFCDAQALLTAVELDLFTVLHAGPATEQEIQARLRLHGRGLSDWLRLLSALGLVEHTNGQYRNTPGADRYLVLGHDAPLNGFLLGAKFSSYPVWDSLADALRTGKPQAQGTFAQMVDNPAMLDRFARMMDGLTEVLGAELIRTFDWSAYHSVLDVGGCRGNLVAQLVTAYPNLDGHVFDLPQLAPLCAEYADEVGMTGRVHFHPGDFFVDPLPTADVIVLGHILHDWTAGEREALVRKVYPAVNPGGALLVYDRMLADEPRSVENLAASITMLLVTEGGSEYTVTELRHLVEAAGFGGVTSQSLDVYETLVVGRKSVRPAE